jgi:PAS domain-containing protein
MHSGSLAELASFLESLAEPHILCDREHHIIAANAAYRSKCGACGDVVGRTCYEVSHHYSVPCDQMAEECPRSRSLRSGQHERVLHLHHSSKGEIYERIEVSPIRNAAGEITHFVERLEEMPVARGLAHAQGLIGRSAYAEHDFARGAVRCHGAATG